MTEGAMADNSMAEGLTTEGSTAGGSTTVAEQARPQPVAPTPTRWRPLRTPLVPAFWVVLALVAIGAWRVALILQHTFGLYPVASSLALLLFALYAVPFILVVRALDYLEREPPLLLAMAFVWGGLVAISTAIPANNAIHNIIAKVISPGFADTWYPAIAGPTTEEPLKALGVIAVVLLARAHVNSVVDGFVYGAMVGLGFQVVEDFIYALNAVMFAADGDQVGPVITVFFVRGFIGGLWSHTLFTALAGAGIGYAVVHNKLSWRRRIGVAVVAFAGAWTLHFVWNTPWLMDGFGYGFLGLLAALLIKGMPGFLAVLLILRAAHKQEATFYAEHLDELHDPELATPGEIKALCTRRGRALARQYAKSHGGVRAAAAVRRLQRGQARLAVELSRALNEDRVIDVPALKEELQELLAEGIRHAHRNGLTSKVWLVPHRTRTDDLVSRAMWDILQSRARMRALNHPTAEEPPATANTWTGRLAAGLGLVGIAVAPLGLVAIVLAGYALHTAKRQRTMPDPQLYIALGLGVVGVTLWLVTWLIRGAGGG